MNGGWLLVARGLLRAVALVASLPCLPAGYYFSLNVRHRYTKETAPPDARFRLPYLTLRQMRRRNVRLFSDIDRRQPEVIAAVVALFSETSQLGAGRSGARVFLTERGAHVVSLCKFPEAQRRALLWRSVECGASHGYVEYQLGINRPYNAGLRLTSKRLAADGSIKVDILPSDEWKPGDPFCIHVMNLAIHANQWVVRSLNWLRGCPPRVGGSPWHATGPSGV